MSLRHCKQEREEGRNKSTKNRSSFSLCVPLSLTQTHTGTHTHTHTHRTFLPLYVVTALTRLLSLTRPVLLFLSRPTAQKRRTRPPCWSCSTATQPHHTLPQRYTAPTLTPKHSPPQKNTHTHTKHNTHKLTTALTPIHHVSPVKRAGGAQCAAAGTQRHRLCCQIRRHPGHAVRLPSPHAPLRPGAIASAPTDPPPHG